MKVGDLIIWGDDRPTVWIVIKVNKTKKIWHRKVQIFNSDWGVIETSQSKLKEFGAKIIERD